jgi:adenylate kinase
MLNIVIFGGPGSGKGTQSALIAEKYNLMQLPASEQLMVELNPETGAIVRIKNR